MLTPTIPTVRSYMDTNTHALAADSDVRAAVKRLISAGVTGVPVVDEQGRVVGRLTEYECLRLLAEGKNGESPGGRVRDFMTTKFTVVPPNMDVYYIAGMFLKDPTTRQYLVMEGEKLVGVVTRKDILRAVQAGLKSA